MVTSVEAAFYRRARIPVPNRDTLDPPDPNNSIKATLNNPRFYLVNHYSSLRLSFNKRVFSFDF